MTRSRTVRSQRAKTGALRPDVQVCRVLTGAGPPLHGGVVVRVMPTRRARGYPPRAVAAMVRAATDAAQQRDLHPTLLVLPAGVGQLAPQTFTRLDWTEVERRATRRVIGRWCAAFARRLPRDHPPVMLGLDGAANFRRTGRCPSAVQVGVLIERRRWKHTTHKTKARDAYEADVLEIAWDPRTDRPLPTALTQHTPTTQVNEDPLLVLVCHDAATFSARSRAASPAGGWAAQLRAQYETLLASPDAPQVAVNLIHVLPRNAASRMVTSPVFQNAHRVLHTLHGVRVIAVAAVHARCAARAFDRLHTLLRCDFQHVDVFITPTRR